MANKDMTVGRMIEYLKTLPKDAPIVLSQDSEGNGYKVLTDLGVSGLNPITVLQCGILRDVEVHCEDDNVDDTIQALILYPD